MFTLLRLIFFPAKVGVGTAKVGMKTGYRAGRIVGYRRLFFVGVGIAIGLLLAHDHAEDGRLARAVGPDEPDLFASIDAHRCVQKEGLFSVLLPDRSHLHVEAVEDTTVIQLALDELLRLMAKYPEFQLTMLRIAANIMQHLVMIDRELPKPAAVGVVHHSYASRPLALALTRRLRQLG